ncbi:ATP-binding protein [Algibacter sp. 2305UL17-15]|uniref:tetratricopeptide repeat-containing sensor histidine kinase n=1 Tax=Algibacter sp. 2305UL17-15 TaxID=3231268 RepID=UPI003459281D
MGKANWYTALMHFQNNDYDSAFYYYNQSKKNFKIVNDSTNTGKQLLSMSIIQQIEDDYIGSKETVAEAIPYLKKKKDAKYLASSYNVLAINHQELLNYKDATTYYLKAIETTNSKADKFIYQNNLATTYIDGKHYNNAITLLRPIEQDSTIQKSSDQYATIIDNLGYAQWLEDKSNTQNLLLKALNIKINNNDKHGQIASYIHLGNFFLKKNPNEALRYLNKAIKTSKQIKSPKGELEALEFLMALKPKSIVYKDRYIALNDSLYKQELKAKTQFAKMKYDDETNQKTILKLEAEKAKQALEVSKQYTYKIIYLSGGLVLILVGGFIVYILKQRHKREKLQEIYTTETRISQKVHDELANDMYHLINKIQNKTNDNQTDVVNQLENIYRRTRDISHENSTINLDNNYFYLELKEMLNAYQSPQIHISTLGLNKAVFQPIDDSKKITILRVLQELMTNMKKHSNASNVVIRFKKDKKNLHIVYTDDGIGLKKTDHFKANGLQNVENRIKNCNGTLNFDSDRKSGVAINISLPI